MDLSQSRYLHEARDHVPLDFAITGTVTDAESDRPTKKLAARTVRRHVTHRGHRRDVMRALFAPMRPHQLPRDQRRGLVS